MQRIDGVHTHTERERNEIDVAPENVKQNKKKKTNFIIIIFLQ